MKHLLRFLILITLSFFCSIASAQGPTKPQDDLAAYIKSNYTKREVTIQMRDGVKLFTCIYEPKDTSQKYPIMLTRTPYSVGPYGADAFKTSLGPDELFAREGYIFAYQDVRGRYMSEGDYEEVRPYIPNKKGKQFDETSDAYDTVEWLVKNLANNSGRVGVYGISYPGFYSSTAGIDGHPAVKAISPQAPVSDWFHGDDTGHNGAVFLAQNFTFLGYVEQRRPTPTPNNDYVKPLNTVTPDGYKYFLELGGLKNAGDVFEKQYGFRLKFWDEMMAHPNYDQFWKDRNILPHLKNIHAAVMTVGGWYDNEDLYGTLETYRSIEKLNPGIFNVLVMGPWFHGGWVRSDGDWLGTAYFGSKTGVYYRAHYELPFFNYFLKDKGDISAIKEVNVFDTGSYEWKELADWSPTASTETALYLLPGGKLSFTKPDAVVTEFDEYVSDPWHPVPYTQKITVGYPRDFMTEDQRFASTRPDVLTYRTDVLTEDVTVAGNIKPELVIASSGSDSDFVVKLIDVFPDDYRYPESGEKTADGRALRVKPADPAASSFAPGSYQMLLRAEPFPARFRNSFEKPEPLEVRSSGSATSGSPMSGSAMSVPTKISYVMPGIVHTFKKGHRIMVQIQSTWFPLVARNPQKFVANYRMGNDADFQKATERVYHSAANPSRIVLPLLKR